MMDQAAIAEGMISISTSISNTVENCLQKLEYGINQFITLTYT